MYTALVLYIVLKTQSQVHEPRNRLKYYNKKSARSSWGSHNTYSLSRVTGHNRYSNKGAHSAACLFKIYYQHLRDQSCACIYNMDMSFQAFIVILLHGKMCYYYALSTCTFAYKIENTITLNSLSTRITQNTFTRIDGHDKIARALHSYSCSRLDRW